MILNWGILGPGKIAHKFASDLMLSQDNRLFAVASRNLERAKAFSVTYNAERSYDSYDALLDDPEVDIVYISTPHHLHAELSIKALNAGKHVLCEKPSAVNSMQLKSVREAWINSGKFFMEGLWTRFNPLFTVYKNDLLKQMTPLNYLYADFCFNPEKQVESRLYNHELAGGSLLDIGIYPVFLAYTSMGMPEEIIASGYIGETGVDERVAMIFKYPEAYAMLYCSFDIRSKMEARIYGTNSSLLFESRWHETRKLEFQINSEIKKIESEVRGNGYLDEIEVCHSMILEGKKECPWWRFDDTLNLLKLLDEVRKQIGLQYSFE